MGLIAADANDNDVPIARTTTPNGTTTNSAPHPKREK